MSEENLEQQQSEDGEQLIVDELELLKQRAKVLGISFSNNIGIESLRAKIAAKLEPAPTEEVVAPAPLVDPAIQTKKQRNLSLREYMKQEEMKLVRCRISNLDPKKVDLPGEVFTVANEYLGTVRKFIPYGEAGQAYHIPMCLYKLLKEKQYLHVRSGKKAGNVNEVNVEQRYVPEFAIEILPPLSPDELAKLAAAQAAGNNLS